MGRSPWPPVSILPHEALLTEARALARISVRGERRQPGPGFKAQLRPLWLCDLGQPAEPRRALTFSSVGWQKWQCPDSVWYGRDRAGHAATQG